MVALSTELSAFFEQSLEKLFTTSVVSFVAL
jgi:hypothetical protein